MGNANPRRAGRRLLAVVLSVVVAPFWAAAGGDERPGPERGVLRLFIFDRPVGTERYEFERGASSPLLRARVDYSHRGKVDVTATLRMARDLTPERYEVAGTTFPWERIAATVEVRGSLVTSEVDGATSSATVRGPFFAVRTPIPLSTLMLLVRYWEAHGAPATLPVYPAGEVSVERLGRDVVRAGGRDVPLDGFSVTGVGWGRATLWLDEARGLAGAVTPHGTDSLCAVRDGLEGALPFFEARAAGQGLAQLARLAGGEAMPAGRTAAVVGGLLFDGTARPPVADSVVLVRDGLVVAAGPRSTVAVPEGAAVVDARGTTVLPGLWDMHAHLKQVEWGPAYLAAGVTTVRDLGSAPAFAVAFRDAAASGAVPAPRVLLAGFIDGPSERPLTAMIAGTPGEGRALVGRYHGLGYDQIKVWGNVRPDALRAITGEAHRLGLTVTGHVPGGLTAFQAVEAGLDQINHIDGLLDAVPGADFGSAEARRAVRFFAERGTVVDPTIVVEEMYWRSRASPLETIEPGISEIPADLAAIWRGLGRPAEEAASGPANLRRALDLVLALYRAGVPVVVGSDQGVPGHTVHREIELLVEAGLTPAEALRAATSVPARVMGLGDRVGTIEAGRRADIVLARGNPLERIRDIRSVELVMAGGRIYRPARLRRAINFGASPERPRRALRTPAIRPFQSPASPARFVDSGDIVESTAGPKSARR